MASKAEVLKVWAGLSAVYPTFARDTDPATLQQTLHIYQELLSDIPYEILAAAAKQHIGSCKWFPTIAELRQAAVGITTAALPERTGTEAWGIVSDTFTDGRYYQFDDHAVTPEFDDPLITATVRAMGGYWHLYGSIRDAHGNPAADRARFIECYDALKRRQREETLLLPGTVALRQQIAARQSEAPQLTDGTAPRAVGDVLRGMLPASTRRP